MTNHKNLSLLLALTLTSACSSHNLSVPKPTQIELINQDSSSTSEVKDDFIETKPEFQRFEKIIKSGNDGEIDRVWSDTKQEANKEIRELNQGHFIALIAIYQQDKLNNFFSKTDATQSELNWAVGGAAEVGNQKLVNNLLSRGANINNAVEGAIQGNDTQLVHNLIQRGAGLVRVLDLAIQNKRYLSKNNKPNSTAKELIYDLLVGQYRDKNDLLLLDKSRTACLAALFDDKETIEILAQDGVSLKAATAAAVIGGHESLMEELIYMEKDKNDAIQSAAFFEKEKAIFNLLKQGASKKEAIRVLKSKKTINWSLIKKIQEFKPE